MVACGGGSAPSPSESEAAPSPSENQSADNPADATTGEGESGNQSGASPPKKQAFDQVKPVGDNVAAGKEGEQGPDMVDVQIGQQYSPGTRVNFPNIGVSFVVPEEWIGQVPQGAEAFVMASTTKQGCSSQYPINRPDPLI